MKIRNKIILGVIVVIILSSFVSAGVGILWDQQSSLVPEKTRTCLTYKVYNPWPEDSYVQIQLSEELQGIIESIEAETKYVPAQTSSSEAIPVEFCFKTPRVYTRDCSLFDKFICKQECTEERKEFNGDVEIIEVSGKTKVGGTVGSATQMSVSAPLTIRVKCIPYPRNYSLIYIIVSLIALILLITNIIKEKKKSNKKRK